MTKSWMYYLKKKVQLILGSGTKRREKSHVTTLTPKPIINEDILSNPFRK